MVALGFDTGAKRHLSRCLIILSWAVLTNYPSVNHSLDTACAVYQIFQIYFLFAGVVKNDALYLEPVFALQVGRWVFDVVK